MVVLACNFALGSEPGTDYPNLHTGVLLRSYPDQEGNKLRLSKVWWAEEWIDLARVGTGGGLLCMW